MKSYRFIKSIFLFLVIMSCFAACSSVDCIVRKKEITDGVLFNKQGELTIIDGKSHRIVPKCEDWKLVGKDKICGKYFKCPTFECKKIFDQEELAKINRFYENLKKDDENITDIIIIKEFKGSVCKSIYTSAGGIETQICRPPF